MREFGESVDFLDGLQREMGEQDMGATFSLSVSDEQRLEISNFSLRRENWRLGRLHLTCESPASSLDKKLTST